MSQYDSDIKLQGESLEDGETYRGDCPACGRSKTFTVTNRDSRIVYNCYSANCAISGVIGGARRGVSLLHNNRTPRAISARPYTGDLEALSPEWVGYLSEKVGFTDWHLRLCKPLYATNDHRIAYPVFGPMGPRRGWCLRTYSVGVQPKTLMRMDVEEPHLSYYRTNPAQPDILVVEDIPSAVRAARYFPQTVAMCGGGIGKDAVAEITTVARRVVWAFDQDATLTALQHHRRFALSFDDSCVLPLEKDLKDMTEEELCQTLKNASL
jgi:hypothetical protein